MINKKVITVTLYNRLDYAEQCLTHINNAYGSSNYSILVSIDGSDISSEMFDLANKLSMSNYCIVEHCINQGCNRNIYNTLNWGFSLSDYVIMVEEDILLARDALQYFEWAAEQYKDDQDVFSVCGYQRQSKQGKGAYSVGRHPTFYPWGWATWMDRWQGIRNEFQIGYGSRTGFNGEVISGTWDVIMKKKLRGNRSTILPEVSRVKNIGEVGAHTPSPEWHRNKHTVDYWSNDIENPVYPPPFKEVKSED